MSVDRIATMFKVMDAQTDGDITREDLQSLALRAMLTAEDMGNKSSAASLFCDLVWNETLLAMEEEVDAEYENPLMTLNREAAEGKWNELMRGWQGIEDPDNEHIYFATYFPAMERAWEEETVFTSEMLVFLAKCMFARETAQRKALRELYEEQQASKKEPS